MTGVKGAQALRDFFFSFDGREMAAAVSELGKVSSPAPDVTDWEAVEHDFNRLFVGPMALEAPPYASVYLDPEPLLMGRETMAVRQVYAELGLGSPDRNSLPEDHLALELDASAVMISALEEEQNPELAELWRVFLQDHLAGWIPGFIQRIQRTPDVHPVFAYVSDQLQAWLDAELTALEASTSGGEYNHCGGRYEDKA